MISPQLLRRYPFFGILNEAQLRDIVTISEESTFEKGETLFEECQPAEELYLLLEGGVDLFYRSEEEYHPKTHKDFHVGEINPGEIFGVSALIEPYVLNATAKASQPGRVVKINAPGLRVLFEKDHKLAYQMMIQVTKVLMERLAATRVQLAAAWAE